MRNPESTKYRIETSPGGDRVLVARFTGGPIEGYAVISAIVSTEAALMEDLEWSAEASVFVDGMEFVMSTPFELSLEQAKDRADAFLRRYGLFSQGDRAQPQSSSESTHVDR